MDKLFIQQQLLPRKYAGTPIDLFKPFIVDLFCQIQLTVKDISMFHNHMSEIWNAFHIITPDLENFSSHMLVVTVGLMIFLIVLHLLVLYLFVYLTKYKLS